MSSEGEDLADEKIQFPWYEKHNYQKVFGIPEKEWKVEAVWGDAYYGAARELIAGVVEGRLNPAYEGVAGLYLFRHYLELALKYVIFHSRWLKDAQTNARLDEIEDVQR